MTWLWLWISKIVAWIVTRYAYLCIDCRPLLVLCHTALKYRWYQVAFVNKLSYEHPYRWRYFFQPAPEEWSNSTPKWSKIQPPVRPFCLFDAPNRILGPTSIPKSRKVPDGSAFLRSVWITGFKCTELSIPVCNASTKKWRDFVFRWTFIQNTRSCAVHNRSWRFCQEGPAQDVPAVTTETVGGVRASRAPIGLMRDI